MVHAESPNSGQKRASHRKALNRTRRSAENETEAASLGITTIQLEARKWREWQALYVVWLQKQRSVESWRR
jgi:hypothetical protein